MTEQPLQERPRILVVDDEQVVALDVEASLDALGYDVVGIAGTGKEALRLTAETCPDLVLMDIQLYGSMDGIAAAGEIRNRWQIPVVFITAFAGEEVLARAKATGPYGYVTKPFATNELNATVAVALQQHRLTKEIFQEHGWLRTLLAGMSDGVIATDTKGQVKFLNPVAEKLTGWTLAEALGQPIEEVYPLRTENGAPLSQCQLRRVLATNQAIGRQRFTLATRFGGDVTVEDSAAPMHDVQGKLTGAVTVIVDVTERLQSERERERLVSELQRSNTALARFSYTVAHDLQAPVRAVKSFTGLLARELAHPLQQKAAEYLKWITGAATGMEHLIQALLRYAQFGEASLKPETFPADEVWVELQASTSALLSETQAELSAGSLPVICADRVQFHQLLQNLVGNAIQYRLPDQAPKISIRGETIDGGWEFAVSDQGEGIAPDQLDRIFVPFARLHGRDVPGTGLGLALCRTIVERHGGRIWAESAGVGQGATIRFVLARQPLPITNDDK